MKMRKIMKKSLAIMLTIAMVFGIVPMSASAAETTPNYESGTWGGIDWTLTEDGTLTIAPTESDPVADASGWTYDVGEWREAVIYESNGNAKEIGGWPYDRSKVTSLVIEEGVTSIGSFAAQNFTNLTGEVVIPSTVTYIGQEAFQKSTFEKLTFAEGGSEELCIAQGAFKNLIIEEVSLPADRPVHLHAWVFNNCHNLKKVTLPATLTGVTGTNHVDYNHNPNAQTGGKPGYSEIFAYNENMETIIFESEAVRDMFYANNNGTSKDYTVATVGLTTYCDLSAAIEAAQDGDTIKLLKNVKLEDTLTIPAGMTLTLDLNGKTISQEKACTASYTMIENKGNLTITGNGKISFKDTGAGDPNFGWGSYTITNRGTMVVENGTIENLSAQNPGNGQPNVHMYCAIQQAAGSTTINDGKISTPTYRSVRINKGELVINGGEFVGQVWLQPNQGDTNLEITGGTFAPTGNDGSSIYMTNAGEGYTVASAAISGGTFATKIGAADPAALAGTITGGTFTATAKENTNAALLAENCEFVENADGTYGVNEVFYAAEVDGVKYESLQSAIDAATTGNVTIKLLDTIADDVTISQKKGLNITIDGNDNVFSGTIYIHGNARYAGEETLTIQNVNFETDEASHYFIDSNSTGAAERYAHNVTVKDSTFTATGNAVNSAVAMRIRQGFNINIENCSANGLHSTLQAYGCTGLNVAGLNAENCKNGLAVGTSTKVVVKDSNINVTGYGVRADGTGAYDLLVKDCAIDAELPVVVRKATGAYELTVEGGTFAGSTYGVVFTNGDDGTFEVPTGTYSAAIDENVSVWPESAYAADVNGVKYFSLADAIAAVQNGETITLVNDCAEDVTIKQTANKSFTIDGAGYKYTGTISINGNRRNTGAETLTIKNVNFVAEKQWQSSIFAEKNTYVHNVTVDGCTFTGNDTKEAYGIRLNHAYNITVKNTTGTNLFDLVYASTMVDGLTVEGVTVTESIMGCMLPYGKNLTFKDVTMDVIDAGVGIYNYNASSATFENCTINAATPVWLEQKNAANNYTVTFNGTNTFTSTEENGAWIEVVGTKTVFKVVLNDTGLDGENTEGLAAVIGDVYYNSLQNAVKAAKDGETITVLTDITFTDADLQRLANAHNTYVKVAGKSVVIDLNGKSLFAEYTVPGTKQDSSTWLVGMFSTEANGHLTLNDSVGTAKVEVKSGADACVYSLISNYNPDCSITINGGSYELDKALDCLVHDNPGKVVVTDGTFTLGNVGTGTNGQPWIFNVNGQNAGHVTVSGGTFNADIANQHWDAEVMIADGCFVVNKDNGTWTVVEGVALNVQTGVGYNDVKTALKDAEAGQTVKLFADAVLDFVIVPVDATLDLNGYVFTAGYVASYGDVVDNSADNTGLLVVDAKQVYLHKDNDQLPVRGEDGYRFYEIVVFNEKTTENKYSFQPVFEGAAVEPLKKGADACGVKLYVRVSWVASDGKECSQDFTYTDALMNRFLNSYNAATGKYGQNLTLTISGADSLNLTFTHLLVSDTGAILSSK